MGDKKGLKEPLLSRTVLENSAVSSASRRGKGKARVTQQHLMINAADVPPVTADGDVGEGVVQGIVTMQLLMHCTLG